VHRKCGRVGVGGHGWQLGAQSVPSARATEEERAEPGKATAPTITSYANFVLDVSVDVRVHGVYAAASDVCYIVVHVHVLTLNSAFALIPFQVPIFHRGTRLRGRDPGYPFCESDKEHG
jgi:hypothetical protein